MMSPFQILSPSERWAPSHTQFAASNDEYEKLLPSLVYRIRLAVTAWRDNNYQGASPTSASLLRFWFGQGHIPSDNDFELSISAALESRFADVTAFAKNTMGEGGVNFKMEYQAEDGNIREYYPDFFVKTAANTFFTAETKGREDLDDIRKIKRLVIWCKDVNAAQQEYTYTPVYVKQEEWEKHQKDIKSFSDVCKIFEVK